MPKDPRNYITVHNGMPEHPKVEPLSDGAFRLLIESWCYCDRNSTDGNMSSAVWAKRGTRKSRTELALAGLVDQVSGGVQFHDYDKHQRTAVEKAEQSAKRVAAGRAGGLAKASNALASATAVAKQTPSKPVAELELEREEEKDSSSEVADAPSDPEREDVERLCQHLADRIESNGSKRPTISASWRRSCRLLLDKDGRTEDQVRRAIDWSQQDSFWMANILSMPKLREKYDQLRLKAAEQTRPALKPVPAERDHFTPPPAPEDIPGRLVVQWNLAWSRANREGRPGPADWRELEAS